MVLRVFGGADSFPDQMRPSRRARATASDRGNEAVPAFRLPGAGRLGPFVGRRVAEDGKDEKTAPTEVVGCILAQGREGKMEIPAEWWSVRELTETRPSFQLTPAGGGTAHVSWALVRFPAAPCQKTWSQSRRSALYCLAFRGQNGNSV